MGLLLLLYYRCCANLELRCVFTEGNLFLLVTPRTVFVITEGLDCHCDCRVGTILAAVAHRAVSADWLNTVIIGPVKASGKPTWLCLVYFFFCVVQIGMVLLCVSPCVAVQDDTRMTQSAQYVNFSCSRAHLRNLVN